MKRRLVYAFISILIAGGLSGFSSPNKTFAQTPTDCSSIASEARRDACLASRKLTEADYVSLQKSAEEIEINYKLGVSINALPSWNNYFKVKDKYLDFLKTDYNSLKNDPNATRRSLETQTLNNFIVYINESIAKLDKGDVSLLDVPFFERKGVRVGLVNVQILANQKFNYAVSNVQFENGAITAEQNAANIKNATLGATTAYTSASNERSQEKCSLLGSSPIISCLDEGVTWFIKVILMNIGGFFVWLFANMFNYAITAGVLNFADWAPEGLYPLWITVRQIISLLIVFVGVYLGFWYILGKGEVFGKFFPWLVLYAVFVNFSYPIVRTAIDLSNIITLNLYSTAVGGEVFGAGDPGGIIMSKVGLSGLVKSATDTGQNFLGSIQSTPGALLAVCYVFYMAYIFFRVTLIMIGRTVAFVFMIVASPILLVDSVLPLLGERAKWLRKIFFEQLLVGPVFMIMFALTLRFLDVFKGMNNLNSLVGGAGQSSINNSTVTVFFTMGIMLIMLHIMIRVTESTAGEVGKFATEKLGTVGGFALGAASAGTGFLARKGLGAIATKARDSTWVKNNQDKFIGRRVFDMSNSLSKSTFDLRKSKMIAGGASALGLSKGMGLTGSIGPKVGYEEKLKEEREDIAARGERMGDRYKEDVKDGVGNIIHRKGDFTPKGLEAKTKYNETLGGRSTFMTKEQKEATKELLKEKVLTGMKKDEAAIKEIVDEKLKDYENIKGVVTKSDGTTLSTKDQKDQILTKLKDDLESVRKSDLNLRGSEAQALSAAINTIQEKNKEELDSFNKQIDGLLFRYTNMKGMNPDDITKKQNDLLNQQDKDVREALLSKLSPAASSLMPQAPTREAVTPPQKSPSEIREEKLAAAAQAQAVEIQKIEAAKRDASPSQPKKQARYDGNADFENMEEDFASIV